MRISDWSSDVCSSDLCAAIALAKGMQIVEIAVKRGSSRDETSHVEAAQGVSRLQCRQRGFEARVDFGARRIRNFIAERGALEHPVLDMTGRGRPKLTGSVMGQDRKSTRLNSSH